MLIDDVGFGRRDRFTGTINWVRLDIGADRHDHLLDPDQLFQFAVSRQ